MHFFFPELVIKPISEHHCLGDKFVTERLEELKDRHYETEREKGIKRGEMALVGTRSYMDGLSYELWKAIKDVKQ